MSDTAVSDRADERTSTDTYAPTEHVKASRAMMDALERCPMPRDQLPDQLALFMSPTALEQILVLHRLYDMVRDVPGHFVEFGCRWGRNILTLANLVKIHEPRDTARRFVAFDTFEGLKGVSGRDGPGPRMADGNYAVTEDYLQWLRGHLRSLGLPITLIHGDARSSAGDWLKREPGAQVALAYFDMDIYAPTRCALEAVLPRMGAGSVLAFDEYAHPLFPGESQAVRDVLGTAELRRLDPLPHVAYTVIR